MLTTNMNGNHIWINKQLLLQFTLKEFSGNITHITSFISIYVWSVWNAGQSVIFLHYLSHESALTVYLCLLCSYHLFPPFIRRGLFFFNVPYCLNWRVYVTQWRLLLNSDKINMLIIGPAQHRHLFKDTTLSLDKCTITQSGSAKNLSVIFDSTLFFQMNIMNCVFSPSLYR